MDKFAITHLSKVRLFQLIFLLVLILFLVVLLLGCSAPRPINQDDPFRKLYLPSVSKSSAALSSSQDKRLLTFSALNMPLSLFARELSDTFNVGVVYHQDLSSKTISGEFKSSDFDSVLTVLSRQLSVDRIMIGNTVYLGPLKDEDKVILVRKVLGHSASNLKDLADSLVSGVGRARVLDGRILVVQDKDFNIRRLSKALDDLSDQLVPSWIVQLYFLILRKDALSEAGMQISTSGTLSYNISQNQFDLKDFKIEGLLSGFLSSSYADLYSSPMFILRDGQEGFWQDGQTVPIPKRSVSDSGTVTTTGFDYVKTGLIVRSKVEESILGGQLTLHLTLSDIQSYVEGVPVTTDTVTSLSVDMQQNKLYLLSELQKYTLLDRSDDLLFSRNKGKSVIQIWGRIYKISAPKRLKYDFFPSTKSDSKKNSMR